MKKVFFSMALLMLPFLCLAANMNKKAPRLRGVMLPKVPVEEDFRHLNSKGASLARYQMCQEGQAPNADVSNSEHIAYFDTWLAMRLDHLEKNILLWARKYKIQIVVDIHFPLGGRIGKSDQSFKMFYDEELAGRFVNTWGKIAERFKGNDDIIYGYDFMNEPVQNKKETAKDCDWWNLQRRCIEAVRRVDKKTSVIVAPPDWGLSRGVDKMKAFPDTNVVYQVHVYDPHYFTHQFIFTKKDKSCEYPVKDDKGNVIFDKASLREVIRPVKRFLWNNRTKNIKIYAGEFSAINWAPGESAARYIADCISIFEENGWDWTYHAFREYPGWSVEHIAVGKPGEQKFEKKADTLRSKVLYSGFKGLSYPVDFPRISDKRLRESCERGWQAAMKTRNPHTGVVTGCDWTKSKPPADAKNNLYDMYDSRPGGWGPGGVGDAPLICGTALSGLVDAWTLTRSAKVKEDAAKVAEGVLNLAVLHGYKGFVCRGFCSDNKTTVSLSSRDQYTHWVHGLWRYASSDIASPAIKERYKKHIVEVAEFMEDRVVPESEWNFGLAHSREKDYRGICYMWGPKIWPHEAARLPMIYIAAYMATGNEHWKELYEKYIDEALEKTLEIKTLDPNKVAWRLPCYSLFQVNTSFEPILAYEKNQSRIEKIKESMKIFADIANARMKSSLKHLGMKHYGMCWDGELLLTQLMSPETLVDENIEKFLEEAIMRERPEVMDVCRAAHILASYWRYKIRTTPPAKN